MKLVDANVLLYAVDSSSDHHDEARGWLDRALNGSETVVMPWAALLAFVRLSTNASIFARPLDLEVALDLVEDWLSRPTVITGQPDAQHVDRMRGLLAATGRAGSLVTDGHLAALAVQYDAQVVTFDSDFGRFPAVSWGRPRR